MNHELIKEHLREYARRRPFTIAREYLMIILMLFPFALMVNWIFVPLNVVGGGLTGICSIIYYATNGLFADWWPEYGGAVPIWLSSLTINILLLIVAILTVGWQFCIRTIVGVLALAFWYRVIPIRSIPLIDDPVSACLLGGFIFGAALGVVMLNNGSSGGTDIVAMIVNKYHDVSLGRVMVIFDLIIIASSYLLPVPENLNVPGMDIEDFKVKRILYGLCMTVSYTVALDWIMNRMRQSVQFMIFSPKYDEIATAINMACRRGVTVLDGVGWYSKMPVKVITVMAKKHESTLIYKIVRAIDPNAFVSQANVNGVYGKGFDPLTKVGK